MGKINCMLMVSILLIIITHVNGSNQENNEYLIDKNDLPKAFKDLSGDEQTDLINKIFKAYSCIVSEEKYKKGLLTSNEIDKINATIIWLEDTQNPSAAHAALLLKRKMVEYQICQKEKSRTKYSLPPHSVKAGNYKTLSAEIQSDILCDISELSYQTIAIQSRQLGVSDLQNQIRNVIAARKWLENTDDIMAYILAIRLQYTVDSYLLNELYCQERIKHNKPVPKNSFDYQLINNLLKENTLDEIKYLSYALELDTEIGKSCRERKYGGDEFLSGDIFNKIPEKLKISIPVTFDKNKTPVTEREVDIRKVDYGDAAILYGKKRNISSKKEARKYFLPMVLGAIDSARDVRFLFRLYKKYNGFSERIKEGQAIIFSDSFKERFTNELKNINIIRFRRDINKRMDRYRMIREYSGRIDIESKSTVSNYVSNIKHLLWPFFRNIDFLSDYNKKRGRNFLEEYGFGAWLNLSD